MTDNTQELDEILNDLMEYSHSYGKGDIPSSENPPLIEARKAKQALLDWHNKQVKNAVATAEDNLDQYWNKELDKQIEEVLDRLEGENAIFKDYKYKDGVLVGTEIVCEGIPLSAIEAERNKLKERDDDQL